MTTPRSTEDEQEFTELADFRGGRIDLVGKGVIASWVVLTLDIDPQTGGSKHAGVDNYDIRIIVRIYGGENAS